MADLVAGAALFIIALIVFHLISHMLSGWVRSGRLNALDRSLGLLAGLVSALLVICVGYLFMSNTLEDDTPDWIETARTSPAVERGALLVRDLLPPDIVGEAGSALQRAQQRANDVDAARKALDRLTRPPETSAPLRRKGIRKASVKALKI